MEDYAKTYFASLVCNHPDGGNHLTGSDAWFASLLSSVCVLRNSIHIYLWSAWSLRSLRSLRENNKRGLYS